MASLSELEQFSSLVLGSIGAIVSLLLLAMRIQDRKQRKPFLTAECESGYIEEIGDNLRIKLEVMVDNTGGTGTTIKRVMATLPTDNGITAPIEGTIIKGNTSLARHASVSLEVQFDSVKRSLRIEQQSAFESIERPWPESPHIRISVDVIHTHGVVRTGYIAYKKGSVEEELSCFIGKTRYYRQENHSHDWLRG